MSRLSVIVEAITGFFQQLVEGGYLSLDYIFYFGLAFEIILIVFFIIKSSFSYELRLDRSLDNLNKWLYYNQYIDESNLIEFNQRMKRVPKLLRYHWQQYMLYRDHEPSHFMSVNNCIEKPLHTSSFKTNIKNLMSICNALMIFTFLLNLATFASGTGRIDAAYILINSLLSPIFIIILNTFFSIMLRSWQNSNLAGLYQNFHLFTRYVDKACTTLPAFIDFEVLFTKEEIKKGIPVLNEYLEKRARQEQKELETAMLNSVEHEDFVFEDLGIDGSQILDRAMKETEIYLNQRQRALAEIQQLESEIESAKRNYENNQKDYQRKMQASKENIDRLRKQQEESTNRIESNYIRKQQTDEIKKQEQLEKDYESTTLRFNQEVGSINAEIKTRQAELEERKKSVEEAMKSEYNTFSAKVYSQINNIIEEKERQTKLDLTEERDSYLKLLEKANFVISTKEQEIKQLNEILAKEGIEVGEHGGFYDESLREEAEKVKNVAFEEEKIGITKQFEEEYQQMINKPETKAEEETVQPEEKTEQKSETTEQKSEPTYDEFGGYYDEKGYYRYQNGSYYDPEGNFFDEFGGFYDTEGTYHPPEEQNKSKKKTKK